MKVAVPIPVPTKEMKEEHVPVHSRIWVSGADGACASLGGLATGGALTYYFTIWRGLDQNLAGLIWILFASILLLVVSSCYFF